MIRAMQILNLAVINEEQKAAKRIFHMLIDNCVFYIVR